MWGKGGEKTGGSRRKEAMLQVWKGRAQEVGVSKKEQEEEKRDSSSAKSMGKDKTAL